MKFEFREIHSNSKKPCQGLRYWTYWQAAWVIEGIWSSACFFAVYPGYAPIAYEHTSLCGLLLLHINQHGSLMLVIPLQPEGTEKQRFCLQLKKPVSTDRVCAKRKCFHNSNQHVILPTQATWVAILWFCSKSYKDRIGGSWSHNVSKKEQ